MLKKRKLWSCKASEINDPQRNTYLMQKIERLKADLHLLSTQIAPNTHKIFIPA